MAQIKVAFVKERDTKNTVRYAEVPRDPKKPELLVIGALYVQKAALAELHAGDRDLAVTIHVDDQ